MIPQPKISFICNNNAKSRECRPIVKSARTLQPKLEFLVLITNTWKLDSASQNPVTKYYFITKIKITIKILYISKQKKYNQKIQ